MEAYACEDVCRYVRQLGVKQLQNMLFMFSGWQMLSMFSASVFCHVFTVGGRQLALCVFCMCPSGSAAGRFHKFGMSQLVDAIESSAYHDTRHRSGKDERKLSVRFAFSTK